MQITIEEAKLRWDLACKEELKARKEVDRALKEWNEATIKMQTAGMVLDQAREEEGY